ncbi:FAD-dependent oxidoreductase [Puniceicoccus vermicola]|uniref:FAD-dependent oxidoreductase n=1 Tax=Puniceicoccus vermicola TaxID=388746 RepID=A0A7X1B1K5_9BACT|nr:FAD-dependent oxidoreductase [Puniceicoccus vermicola]MBC2603789.1 FAD-dependent oxidoreductase [Puniceicoccus vermicola]
MSELNFKSKPVGQSLVSEPARDVPVARDADVVVCGAGPAGVAAAIASAASGAKTVLIESAGCLGGVWTSGLLTYVLDPKGDSPVTNRLTSELDRLGGYARRKGLDESFAEPKPGWAEHCFIYEPETMKWVLERECLQLKVNTRLYTRVCSVVKDREDPRKITAVITESKSGREAWGGKIFIDATGDGDLAAQAGCRFSLGRPDSGEVQPLTLMCMVQTPHVDRVQPLARKAGKCLKEAIEAAGVNTSYGAPVLFEIRPDLYGFMMNHKYGSALNADELSKATFEARNEVMLAIRQMRDSGGPWEGLRVVATGAHIGIREGRRIQGRYTVTAEDLTEGRSHSDAVCRVHFPIDVHATKIKGKSSGFDAENKMRSQPYDVPLRAMIAADVDNLMMAGRNISGDFIAHSSYRVTGNSVAMGEAAGAFAADVVRRDETLTDADTKRVKFCLENLEEALGLTVEA